MRGRERKNAISVLERGREGKLGTEAVKETKGV